mmetsp:Transcript_22076/g.68792  ORF Transcript_22076/g.68792 Transcript_22076/m.68792 type:complete len:287 (-) Transcript_22076:2239-3099(-)
MLSLLHHWHSHAAPGGRGGEHGRAWRGPGQRGRPAAPRGRHPPLRGRGARTVHGVGLPPHGTARPPGTATRPATDPHECHAGRQLVRRLLRRGARQGRRVGQRRGCGPLGGRRRPQGSRDADEQQQARGTPSRGQGRSDPKGCRCFNGALGGVGAGRSSRHAAPRDGARTLPRDQRARSHVPRDHTLPRGCHRAHEPPRAAQGGLGAKADQGGRWRWRRRRGRSQRRGGISRPELAAAAAQRGPRGSSASECGHVRGKGLAGWRPRRRPRCGHVGQRPQRPRGSHP